MIKVTYDETTYAEEKIAARRKNVIVTRSGELGFLSKRVGITVNPARQTGGCGERRRGSNSFKAWVELSGLRAGPWFAAGMPEANTEDVALIE
jgi:hypothetical protein